MTQYLIPDRFILMILAALMAGWFLPVRGATLGFAQNVIFAGIFALFFLHGLRLPRHEVAKAARGWRLQAAMLVFCFGAMPLAGWALSQTFAAAGSVLPPLVIAGLVYTSILPSTVQSAISYTSIAGGNVAASVVGAALSNLAGIILTPLLAALLLSHNGGLIFNGEIIIKIAVLLLLPFALGQAAQYWLGSWAAKQKKLLSIFDKSVILLAVYIAFAGAVASGALGQITRDTWTALLLAISLLLAFAFGGAFILGKMLKLERRDKISLLYAGAHKSIATGAPMAAILFGSNAGLIILPAVIYHIAQLIFSAPLAARLAAQNGASRPQVI